MKLGTLDKFDDIVVQMHDNPDADAVGSGYAMYRYFLSKGKKVRLVYGGPAKITKSNMLLLIDELKIPAEYLRELKEPLGSIGLLLTVDCQYGEGNVEHIDADTVAMIDHHNTGRVSDEMAEIRSHIVSCSTICYDMLRLNSFDVNKDTGIATALYYGLFMDSNELSEIRHPLERDMLDFLNVNRQLFNRLTHANFTLQEFETAGMAMLRYNYNENKRFAIIKSKPCDPNILGLVGDLVLQVDSIDVCIIFNELPEGYKLSVRSCVPDVTANDMAEYLTENIGNGGGHLCKAGGFINKKKYAEVYGGMGIDSYIFTRTEKYYDSYDVIYAKNGISDKTGFSLYKKRACVSGYVKTTDILSPEEECKVRTFEGDVFVRASEDIYLMIGYYGEVYPIEREIFEKKYEAADLPYAKEFEYAPTIREMSRNKIYELLGYAKQCVRKEDALIYAKRLDTPAKVFSKWDYEKYMYGGQGDYLCFTKDDDTDVYTVKREVFEETYESVKNTGMEIDNEG